MAEVRARLERLKTLTTKELRLEWQELFGKPTPAGLRKEIVIRILAYRIQERAFGGLSKDALRRLAQLSKVFAANPAAQIPDVPPIKPGTRLVRSWQGEVHTVTVTERGYEYKSRRYGSLSEVARLITGTRWNGPLFFGLRNGRKERLDVA